MLAHTHDTPSLAVFPLLTARSSDLTPLHTMTPEQRVLIREYMGLEESLLSARMDTLSRELGDLKTEVKNLANELHGKVDEVEKELSDTQKTHLVEKLEDKQRELDRLRHSLGIKSRKSDQWKEWAWKVLVAIALGVLARHVLGILFPHAIGG